MQRTAFELRLAATGDTREAVIAALRAHAEAPGHGPSGGDRSGVFSMSVSVTGRVAEDAEATPVVLVFSGQGPQWWGMGRQLMDESPVFRAAVEAIDRELRSLGWLAEDNSSLLAELSRSEDTSRMGETRIAQPAIYALQIGLTEYLTAHGVRPAAVIGHSIGELAAAVCAGAISVAEGARIVYWRSRCQAKAEGKGRMAAVGLSEAEARAELRPYEGAIEIAAINGPRTVTVAGDRAAVDALHRDLDAREVFCRVLNVSVPFHCYMMDDIADDFRRGLGSVAAGPTRIPFISTVTAAAYPGEHLDCEYWYRNIRKPVLFHQALSTLLESGQTCFVEVGPQPILKRGAEATMAAAGVSGMFIPTLRRKGSDSALLKTTLASLFVAGGACRPVPTDAISAGRVSDLPPYPLAPQSFWNETGTGRRARMRPRQHTHPHMRTVQRSVHAEHVFTCELALDPGVESYLAEHVVQDLVVFPGAGQLELALAAGQTLIDADEVFVEDVEFRLPMVLSGAGEAPVFRLEVYSDDGRFTIASQMLGTDEPVQSVAGQWSEHTRGRIHHSGDRMDAETIDLSAIRSRVNRALDVDALFAHAGRAGLVLGPSFRGIRQFWVGDGEEGESLSAIDMTESLADEASRFTIHPALLDSIIQTGALGSLSRTATQGLFLPHRVAAIRVHRAVTAELGRMWCYARETERTPDQVSMDIAAVADDGTPVVTIRGLVVKYIQGSSRDAGADDERLYELIWAPEAQADPAPPADAIRPDERPDEQPDEQPDGQSDLQSGNQPGTWIVLASRSAPAISEAVIARLRRAGNRVLVEYGDGARDMAAIAAAAGQGDGVAGMVHLWTLDCYALSDDRSVESGEAARRRSARAELLGPIVTGQLVTALGQRGAWRAAGPHSAAPAVWLVTRGVADVSGAAVDESSLGGLSSGHPADREDDNGAGSVPVSSVSSVGSVSVDVAGAGLWGFGRVLGNEQPHLVTTLVDLAPGAPDRDTEGAALAAAILAGPGAHEIALRDGRQYSQQVRWHRADATTGRIAVDGAKTAYRAEVATPGILQSIILQAYRPRPLAAGEVELAVRAVGLNFKDVVVGMAMLSDEAWRDGLSGAELGLDCAGVVTAVGEDAGPWKVGDEVVAMAPG
ncbi:MAG: acyltransferase domain-containing protein, partial [Myxococcota bacterium]